MSVEQGEDICGPFATFRGPNAAKPRMPGERGMRPVPESILKSNSFWGFLAWLLFNLALSILLIVETALGNSSLFANNATCECAKNLSNT
jgi:hypothetical protein